MAKRELKLVVSNEPEPRVIELPPQQHEMPFAVVNGEPVTELPKDLYIPPQALEVFLEAFEGPLDLLLYLIRRQNLDVLDIPIAEITRQYMKYIEVMTEMQLELAGEYMVMAATLAEIKSRMLLPRAHAEGDGTEEDPRAELVRRLQEYERFKQAAENIDGLERLERDTWNASAELKDRQVVRLVPQFTLQEMLLAFKDVVVRSEMFAHHHIQRERLSIRQRMSDIVSILEHASFVEFSRLFRAEEGRMGVTVTFVAILELVREGLIEIVQTEPFAPLHVRPAGAHRGLKLVANNERGEEEIAVKITPQDEGPTADELLLASTEPFEDDDDDFEEEDGPLEGVDDVVVEQVSVSTAPDVAVAQTETDVVAEGTEGVSEEQSVRDELSGFNEPSVSDELSAVVIEPGVSDELSAVVDELSVSDELSAVVDEPSVPDELSAVVIEPSVSDELNAVVDEPSVSDELSAVVIEPGVSDELSAMADESSASDELNAVADEATVSAELSAVADEPSAFDEQSASDEAAVSDDASAFDEATASDEAASVSAEASVSNEPSAASESGDADEADADESNELSDKPPVGGTSG